MSALRALVGAVVILASMSSVRAETFLLKETLEKGDCFRFRLDMTFRGEIRVQREDKPATLPLTARAAHEFLERVLAVGEGVATRTARYYESAGAAVNASGDRTDKVLRRERRLFVAQRSADSLLVYSPAGSLTREELELTAEHFDTLALVGLLPGRAVAQGDTWKIPSPVVQALCHFEGLTDHELTGKLEEVKDGVAVVRVTGPANGIELGAQVKLTIDAACKFDLAKSRLTEIEWKQSDDRQQGPASPSMTVQSTTTVTRTAIKQPDTLSDVALVSVPQDGKVPEQLTALEFRDTKGRFELTHARDWQVVGNPDGKLVLRLMERGDFVAQATISPWTSAPKGRRLSDDEFRAAMARTPGWEPEKELQAGEVPGTEGKTIFRLSTLGKMDGLAVVQNFYLIAGENGEQVVVAITLTPKKVEQLGSRELSLAGSIEFPKK